MTCIPIKNGIACISPEVEVTGVDLRTREGREAEVLAQIREHGGWHMFWPSTPDNKRANAIDRLVKRGVIEYVKGGSYSWAKYRLMGDC